MSVGKVCTRIVAFATPAETVEAAARRMSEHNVGTLVVVDGDRRPRGIVTDRDIVVRCVSAGLTPAETQVAAIMTAPARTVSESTPIEEALRIMRNIKARRLVVTDSEDTLVGLLSLDDVIELIAEEVAVVGELLRRESPEIRA